MREEYAFPSGKPIIEMTGAYSTKRVDNPGMSLRDYFAGQLIIGHALHHYPSKLVTWAYEIADLMLEERDRVKRKNKEIGLIKEGEENV